jgi:spore coat assembly protein
MIKKNQDYNNMNNYRNSKYFAEAAKMARMSKKGKDLAIFAGACQSFYEALIRAGANFASSPARILIDYADPLIVAENIAKASYKKFVTINDFAYELRDGKRGIDGIGAYGKRK